MNRIWILGLFLGIPALAEDEPEKLERPHFTMFGFTVHADNIDLNLGEAKGDVVAVGTVEGKPITVKADLLKVNLAEQSVLLSGWPSVIMKGVWVDGEERGNHGQINEAEIHRARAGCIYAGFKEAEGTIAQSTAVTLDFPLQLTHQPQRGGPKEWRQNRC